MRHIGTLPDETQARRFDDYLLTLDIKGRVEPEDGTWAVWVYDEDRVETAREELARFREDPQRSEYQQAVPAARERRREELKQAVQFRRKQVDVRREWEKPLLSRAPVTSLLMAASVLVAALTTDFSQGIWNLCNREESFVGLLFFTSPNDFPRRGEEQSLQAKWKILAQTLRSGQVHRLVTPIFIHVTLLHILFNMIWLVTLGSQIEVRRGSWRMLLLVLFIAVASNAAQFFYENAAFGGMSGVDFGLFGYLWMKSRYDPQSGFFMPPVLVFMMIGWMIYCFLTPAMNVANAAHAGGLIAGGLVGLWPVIRRNLWGRS